MVSHQVIVNFKKGVTYTRGKSLILRAAYVILSTLYDKKATYLFWNGWEEEILSGVNNTPHTPRHAGRRRANLGKFRGPEVLYSFCLSNIVSLFLIWVECLMHFPRLQNNPSL